MSARRFKRYPAYKDSGVEWLGEIPAHWTAKRVRQACSRVTDGAHISPDTSSADVPFVSTVDIRAGAIDFDACLRTSDASYGYMERTGCRPKDGDVLFSKDGTVGTTAVVTTDRAFAVASSLVILSPDKNEVDARWLNHWLNGVFIKEQVELLLSGAALRRISVAKVGRLPVLLPPKLDEQRAIAAFLDRESARIDALVAKKERLIELLQEQRTALITRAVTKGLDPNVPMKDSGVEWLGEIPAHWESVRVKGTLSARISGPFGSSLTKDSYGGSTYRVYGQEQVIPGDFRVGDYYIPESKYQSMKRYAVQEGDVLLSCVGTFGRAAVVPKDIQPGIINPRLILLRPEQRIIVPAYLECFLKSRPSFAQMDEISRGGTMDIINLTMISALVMPLPPKSEQDDILKSVQLESNQLDRLVASVRDAIDRLKELRTALISAAVTGKIDVRGTSPETSATQGGAA